MEVPAPLKRRKICVVDDVLAIKEMSNTDGRTAPFDEFDWL